MRPDIPQKSGTAPSTNEDRSPLVDNRESVTSEVSRPSCNRAAAMLGIAISVGAGSLIAPSSHGVAQAYGSRVPQSESLTQRQVSAGEPIVLEATVAAAATVSKAAPIPSELSPAKAPVKGPEFTAAANKQTAAVSNSKQVSAKAITPKLTAIAQRQSSDHSVQPGETLWQIAQAYQVDVRALANANQLSTGSVLKVGQKLSLPQLTLDTATKDVVKLEAIAAAVPELPELSAATANQTEATNAERQATPSFKLRAQRDQLKQSMAELVEESNGVVTATDVDAAQSAAELPVADLSKVDLPAVGGAEPTSNPLAEAADAESATAPAASTKTEFDPKPLLNEIRGLRDQYNTQPVVKSVVSRQRDIAVIAKAEPPVTATSEAEPKVAATKVEPLKSDVVAVKPDFAGRKSESALSIELRNFVQPKLKSEAQEKVQSAPLAKRQVVARATLGSEAYAPVTPSVQKMVSPNLPEIGSEDAYLPGGTVSQGYVWPAKGVLSSGYGWRWGRMHRGIDIAAPVGTPIVASASGVVTYARWNNGGFGYLVEVEHADGTMTRYAHNNRILVKEGQQVAQGQQVSEMGSTGFSTGPHLHFEIHPRGSGAVNPMAMLSRQS